MSRNNEFFHACKVDNWYVFEHTEYEWDDIVNAFIAGGLYADRSPRIQWVKLTEETVMHPSQKELVHTGEYSIFSVEVRPTFDFQQELLWNGDALEVLEPFWLRKEMAGVVKRMWNNYSKK